MASRNLSAPSVVMAAGGLPIPKMGATDFGLRTARKFGLKVTDTAPALVPLTITGKDQPWFEQLSVTVFFAAFGMPGPALKKTSCLPTGD
jgi:predicted flavoprotein YhiN